MENELRRVVDALPGLVWTALADGQVDFVNQRWCDYTGLNVDEARGRGLRAAIHPEDQPGLLERWRSILAAGEPGEMEARLRRFDGQFRWFLFRTSPIADTSGQITKWSGISIDIEDRGRSVRTRNGDWSHSSPGGEDHFRSIVDELPVLVSLMTPDGELAFANRQLLEYLGVTLDELKRRPNGSSFHPDDRPGAVAAWREAIETGRPYDFEGRRRRADGFYRWFHMRGFPLRDSEGRIVLWYLLQTDADDRKRAEALLAGERRLLEMVARGHPRAAVLDALCRLVEDTIGGCYCGAVLVDPGGTRLEHGAAPSLPASFINSIIGRPVNVGSAPSAMAACLNEQVIATDLRSETRWVESGWCRMALAHGILACWSTPISSTASNILGAFTIYYKAPTTPTSRDRNLIERCTHIASIVAERVQSDAALRRSEARKAAILDSALDCIVTIDHEGRITEFNPAAERTFGFKRDNVVGRLLADIIIPPSLREPHQRGLARFLATGEATVLGRRLELTAIRSDGSEFPVELGIVRIPLDGPPSFTGYLRDITERQQSEEKLRRSQAFLAEAQHLSSTGSFSWRVATNEVTWSEQVYRILEFDQDVPMTFERLIGRAHPEDVPLLHATIDRARGDGGDFEHECRLLMDDRSVKYLHTIAHGSRDRDGQLEYIGAIQDVTQRRLSEEVLGKVRSELAHMARITSLGALTASIAHEVNQPLSGIVTNASTCMRMLAADPPNIDGARETARRTIRDGNRAAEVITRLRALFSKKDATIESVDLNDAAREVIALSLTDFQRNRVILRQEFSDDLPAVTGDRVQLQQVILNLLLNASDAMRGVDDRSRRLEIKTERDEANHVRLTVKDTGAGLDAKSVDRLFEAFYSTKSDGMGIGLSVSRSIIEHHRGRLWAAPNDGPGATFAFSVPCGRDNMAEVHGSGAIATPAVMDAERKP
jgi:PAS domain S-box-containing protein